MVKNSPKPTRIIMIITLITGFAAVAVGIVAIARQEYLIAAAMALVATFEFIHFNRWRKLK